jgi:hypothetical protein
MTNARIAGVTFLLYIVAGIGSMAVAEGPMDDLLGWVTSLCALALGVTLYAITREQEPDLALFALTCRVVESIPTESGQSNAFFFAVGSTVFCWLLLRGRMIPVALARVGVVASALLVVILPLQHAGLFGARGNFTSTVTWLTWMPMLAFELALALWLIAKGVEAPAARPLARI